MKIFAPPNGLYTLESIPAVSVFLITSPQTIPSSAFTALSFGGKQYDSNGFHDNSVNPTRITIVVPGLYDIHGSVYWAAGTLGTVTILGAFIYKNGVQLHGAIEERSPISTFSTFGQGMQVRAQQKLLAGDYLELMVYHDKTAAGTLAVSTNYTGLSVVRLGS